MYIPSVWTDVLILSSSVHKELCLFIHYTWKYWGQTVKVSTFKKSGKVKEACWMNSQSVASILFCCSYCMWAQAGLFLCNFFLCDFTPTQLEILHHFSNLHDNVQFNAIWHRWYMIIFGLRQFGIDKMWLHLPCVGG